MNGHDGNIPSIETAAHQVKVACPEMKIVGIDAWWNMIVPLLPPGFFEVYNGLGHGGEGELSISLTLFPELCRPELVRGIVPDLPANLDVMWRFSEITDCGVSGDPTKATREKGIVRGIPWWQRSQKPSTTLMRAGGITVRPGSKGAESFYPVSMDGACRRTGDGAVVTRLIALIEPPVKEEKPFFYDPAWPGREAGYVYPHLTQRQTGRDPAA